MCKFNMLGTDTIVITKPEYVQEFYSKNYFAGPASKNDGPIDKRFSVLVGAQFFMKNLGKGSPTCGCRKALISIIVDSLPRSVFL